MEKGKPIVFDKELKFKDFYSEYVKLLHLHSETGAAIYDLILIDNNLQEVKKIPTHAPFIENIIDRDDWIINNLRRKEHSKLQLDLIKETKKDLGDKLKEHDIVIEINVPEKNKFGPAYTGETYRKYMLESLKTIIKMIYSNF
ncbi:MAG: hypothetical protein ACP5OZ_04015 [Candidatus Woesearchaeota archaeon]